MLKSYSDTDMLWDTESLRWVRPKKVQKINPPSPPPPAVEIKDPADMTWKEFLLDTYSKARMSSSWELLKNCHDDEDKNFFMLLDEMLKISN